MCSIMGYCSRNAVLSVFMEGFQKTISRGPDDTRIINHGIDPIWNAAIQTWEQLCSV